ncbi:MAG: ABC transporter permease [Proteobacteria bacterium]|nr:ABC transporter permease [Pseudomonadota bacterium]
MFWNSLRLALSAIRRNLVRSGLTVLGIVIGVAAVVTMVTLGDGATRAIKAQIASLGSNMLMVRPGQRISFGRDVSVPQFRQADLQAIRTQVSSLRAVAGGVNASATVVYGSKNWATQVGGVTGDYLDVRQWTLSDGRDFNDAEQRAGKSVCILGETVRRQLFGAAQAVGTRIRVRQFSCDVIGVLTVKGQASMGADQDDLVLMPLRTVQRRMTGSTDISALLVAVADDAAVSRASNDLTRLLRERRRIGPHDEDNFNVLDTRQIADALSGTTRIMTMLLAAVAAVSLLVGGIGIMNIMLVSVTERTREIGIRLAVGALERDVLTQFLVEAVTLSCFGGIIGLLLAAGASAVLARIAQVPFVFNPTINLLAFVVSAAIGVVFGYFPARRAAALDPIEALRHE